MQHLERLLLDPATRAPMWQTVIAEIERYIRDRDQLSILPNVSPNTIRADLATLDFVQPLEPLAAIDIAVRGMREQHIHPGTGTTSACSTQHQQRWVSPPTHW